MTTEEMLRKEHSSASRARKVINAPVAFATHGAADRSIDPINATVTAASAEMDMDRNKVYRLVSSVDMHFRMSKGTSAAVTTDIFLAAGQPIVIQSGEIWDKVSVIKAASATADGLAQITEMV